MEAASPPVYAATASVHFKGEDSKEAAREVLRADPDFSIKAFVVREPYRDCEQRKRLQGRLLGCRIACVTGVTGLGHFSPS